MKDCFGSQRPLFTMNKVAHFQDLKLKDCPGDFYSNFQNSLRIFIFLNICKYIASKAPVTRFTKKTFKTELWLTIRYLSEKIIVFY